MSSQLSEYLADQGLEAALRAAVSRALAVSRSAPAAEQAGKQSITRSRSGRPAALAVSDATSEAERRGATASSTEPLRRCCCRTTACCPRPR